MRRKGGLPLPVALGLAAVALVAACSPQDVALDVTRAAAKSVVLPVVAARMPAPEAEIAAICIIDNASVGELNALTRDVGTRAGTLTVATVMSIIGRPATRDCLAARGIAPLRT